MKNLILVSIISVLIGVFSLQTQAQTWEQIANDINGEAADDMSGLAVSSSADGSIVAIGAEFNDYAQGHVRVFRNNEDSWLQIGDAILGEDSFDQFGRSVSLSSDGSILAIGSIYHDEGGTGAGYVKIYENNADNWIPIGEIHGQAGDYSGQSVSLSNDGSILAIGAFINGDNGFEAGKARVYENISGNWVQMGNDINGETGDRSGETVCLNAGGSVLAVGAYYNDANGSDAGCVRVYEYDNGLWQQIGTQINGHVSDDELGTSISLNDDGTIMAIGSLWHSGVNYHGGYSCVYQNNSGSWQQIGADIHGEAAENNAGTVSLNADGSILAVGAYGNCDNGVSSGKVKVFENSNDNWVQIGEDIIGEASYNYSGVAISLSANGNIVFIGASGNDNENGEDAGHVRAYEYLDPQQTNTLTQNMFSIFPNPSQGKFTIYNTQKQLGNGKLIIRNTNGQRVFFTEFTQFSNINIDISNHPSGVYLLEISAKDCVCVQKIIIE